MINNKTATLLIVANSNKPKRFFVQTVESDGEVFESADFNLYQEQVKLVIADYKNRGYTVINKLPKSQKVEFTEQPKVGTFGKWVTKDGFTCYTDNRATAVRWYKKHLWEQEYKSK
ncbi:hypothetical protein [Bacteroides thetaiotaomicron]|uniref:hypothetical protein n=1 Tax=Bacteroides thetaiotaomicron TaxID=818 RepID=UPI001F2C3DCA|nr:hypothetical protein [Bacteroides thetaiotaomicron]